MQQQVGLGRLLQGGAKASTSLCGRSRMKPTVSDSDTLVPADSRYIERVVVSSVANSWLAA